MARHKPLPTVPRAEEINVDSVNKGAEMCMEVLSKVEPFLDFDLAAQRHQLVDDMVLGGFRRQLAKKLSNLGAQDQIDALVNTLAEMRAELHYLKAAYIESTRYQDPTFDIKIPPPPRKLRPDVLEVDLRGEITGANWWLPESWGRWAGPENRSSLLIPAMGPGRYRFSVYVVSEVEEGILDGMKTSLNRNSLTMSREGDGFPYTQITEVEVPESYKLPFWTINFDFHKLISPQDKDVNNDPRRLAIMIQYVRFTRLG